MSLRVQLAALTVAAALLGIPAAPAAYAHHSKAGEHKEMAQGKKPKKAKKPKAKKEEYLRAAPYK